MGELVTLDGYPLSGVTRHGIWKINSLPGWRERPAVKRNNESRTAGDGSFKTPVFYENRLITINGRLFSKNHEYLHQAEGILNALGHRGGAKLLVEGHGPTQWATVDPRGNPELNIVTGTFLQFQIPLEAIDPFKYGESHSPSGSVGSAFDVFQRGTVEAFPVVTVSGSLPGGYELTLGGRLVSVTRAVTSGSPHTLDMRTGILRVGGSVARGGISYSELFSVKPGMAQSFYSLPITSGSGTVTLRYNDTFI